MISLADEVCEALIRTWKDLPLGLIFACLHTSIVASRFVSTIRESSSSGVRFKKVV